MDPVNLCSVCHNLAPISSWPYSLLRYEQLLSSAGCGCVLCKVVLDAMTASGAETLPEAIEYIEIKSQLGRPVKITVRTKRDKSSKGIAEIALSGIKGEAVFICDGRYLLV